MEERGDNFYSGKSWAQKEASSDLRTLVLKHSWDASIIEFPAMYMGFILIHRLLNMIHDTFRTAIVGSSACNSNLFPSNIGY